MGKVTSPEFVDQYWRRVRELRADEARCIHSIAALDRQRAEHESRLRELRGALTVVHKMIEEVS